MKALTISQPFASLIVEGEKRFENRTWECHYRGNLAIHAGKGTQYLTRKELLACPTRKVVGGGNGADCVHGMEAREALIREQSLGRFPWQTLEVFLKDKHFEGPFAIVLDDIAKLDSPIEIPGAQGLWNVPQQFIAKLEAELPIPF